jgi:hypothetical protein
LSCGLFAQYAPYLGPPKDVFKVADCLPLEPPQRGRKPSMKQFLTHVIEQLRTSPAILDCQTLLILSDTNKLEQIPHWKHTARWIIDRTAYSGPDLDKWFALFVPSEIFKCHFVWTATYILKALIPFLPGTDLVLLDNNAAFTALFENKQLSTLAVNLHLPYRHAIKHLGMLTITEPASNANAGIVWFPRHQQNSANEPNFNFSLKMRDALFNKAPVDYIVGATFDHLQNKRLFLLHQLK